MQKEKKSVNAEDIFASKGTDVVRSGMTLILDRLKFAKKYDVKIREAICALDENSEIKAAQLKILVDALKRAAVMDTSEILSLVTQVIERLGVKEEYTLGREEVLVTLDDRVEKWAQ